jgi:hypothetical protein
MRNAIVTVVGGFGLAVLGCQGSDRAPGEAAGSTSQAVSSGGGLVDEVRDALARPPDPHWTALDDRILGPIWSGDDTKGAVYGPLFRGGFPGMEDTIYTPDDNDCRRSRSTIRVDWDQAANTVHFMVKGKRWPVSPNVTRTEGVTWFPNTFHNDPKDIVNGAYRLWIILGSTTDQTNFFYDPNTLLLLGTVFDLGGPPPNTIAIPFPIFSLTGSNQFDPDSNGNALHEFTLNYSAVTNESATFSRTFASFVPQDLCETLPMQPDKSQLRPYVTPWQPLSPAPNWHDMLHAGIGFSVQIDERVSPNNGFGGNLPYVYSGVDFLSNLLALQGGVPHGSGFQIITAIRNVAPGTLPIPFGDGLGCQVYIQEGTHVTKPRYCQGQQ